VTIETSKNTISIGGDMLVDRLGYGAMQLTGPGVWGPPADIDAAQAVLRKAVDLGVTYIDTADVYGPGDNERLIRDALRPYSRDIVVGTKGGMVRSGPATRENPGMAMNGSEAHIRAAVEGSLRDLGVERIDLYQQHRVDPATPIEDTMAVFRALQQEGKIRHIGLSEVSVAQIEQARAVVDIATVQNVYSLAIRRHNDVLAYCEANAIAFIAFWPIHLEHLASSPVLGDIAARMNATRGQVAIAWILNRSRSLIAIPGTSSVAHLSENMAARDIVLAPQDIAALDALDFV